jgi:hypothetical protein
LFEIVSSASVLQNLLAGTGGNGTALSGIVGKVKGNCPVSVGGDRFRCILGSKFEFNLTNRLGTLVVSGG